MATSVLEMSSNMSRRKIHPKKFALFAACASMVMLFSGLTSAYIVRQSAGNWLEFQLPSLFYVNTAVIVLSSILLHFSYIGFKKERPQQYRLLLIGAMLLGVAFLVLQYLGWQQLMEIGVPLRTNPSGDFVYVISGIHAAHVLGGVAALIVALLHAYMLPFKVTEGRKLRFELTFIYWHFVDFLWVYLLFFLVLAN